MALVIKLTFSAGNLPQCAHNQDVFLQTLADAIHYV